MTDNRTTELLDMLYAFLIDYQNILKASISEEISEKEMIARQRAIVREHAERIEQAIAATLGEQRSTVEIAELLDEFEHECYMLRVEASETRARDDVVREAYERIRDEFAGRIAATLGNGTCELVTSEHDYDSLYYHEFSCWHSVETDNEEQPNYCPECGAKVVKR